MERGVGNSMQPLTRGPQENRNRMAAATGIVESCPLGTQRNCYPPWTVPRFSTLLDWPSRAGGKKTTVSHWVAADATIADSSRNYTAPFGHRTGGAWFSTSLRTSGMGSQRYWTPRATATGDQGAGVDSELLVARYG